MPKKKVPEELAGFWDEEVQEAWSGLNPKQQAFFLAWINNNFNATKAYRASYNKLANDNTAAACGSQYLRNSKIQQICEKMSQTKGTDLVLIRKAYKDALQAYKPVFKDGEMIEEIDDHSVRITAAEKLAKLNGELIDKAEREVKVKYDKIEIEFVKAKKE